MEILIVAAVAKQMALRAIAREQAINYSPVARLVLVGLPAGQVLAVEELHPAGFRRITRWTVRRHKFHIDADLIAAPHSQWEICPSCPLPADAAGDEIGRANTEPAQDET